MTIMPNRVSQKDAYNGFHFMPAIGQKHDIVGLVLYQSSTPIDTNAGRVYSHFHVIQDEMGKLYHYKGSSFYPLHSKVAIRATIKGYCRDKTSMRMITIIKAPKSL